MDRWLDSLSEDWVSQPRSHHSSSIVGDSPSPTSNGSQSRIPRLKTRTTSNLSSVGGTGPQIDPNRRSLNGKSKVLKDVTSASINASQRRRPSGQVKPSSQSSGPKAKLERQASTRSLPPVEQGTVQVKSSPAKPEDAQAAPEWKKRMLQGRGWGADRSVQSYRIGECVQTTLIRRET